MAGSLFIQPWQSPLNTGVVMPGAKLFFYIATTATKQNTYTTSALSTPHSNPVVADGNGRFAAIWLDPELAYKVVLTTTGDSDPPVAAILTEDNVRADVVRIFDVSSVTEPGLLVYSNYATASRQANITSITYGVSGGGTFHANQANGTYASPTATLSGDLTGGIGSRAYHNGGAFQTSSPAAIHWQATENQTSTAYGMWMRFLSTPKGTTTRQERGGITDNGTMWIHGPAGTWNPLSDLQTIPISDAKFVASGNGGADGGAAYVAVCYNQASGTAGFRGLASRGTPAAPSASQSGDLLAFLGGHGFGATIWSAASKGYFAIYASENWTDAAQGTRATIEVTPVGSTTRAEALRVDASATATHVRLMVYDVDNGQMERVTVGAADSGGAGFKLLRIAN